MEKKYEDDELAQLIDEQFLNEAQIMEEALFSDDDTEDYEASDEEIKVSYQKLVARLKEDGVYREDGEDNDPEYAERTSLSETGRVDKNDRVIPIAKKKRFNYYKAGKVAGVIIVSGLCVFSASMTSEANRNYFVRNVRYMSGHDTRVVISNDDQNEKSEMDEYEAVNDIEEQLGIEVPEFSYYPKGFEFYKYETVSASDVARIEYKYNDCIVTLEMDRENDAKGSRTIDLHGDEIDSVEIEESSINVKIKRNQDVQDEVPSYMAQWEKDDVVYNLSGKIEYEELKKILRYMRIVT